MFFPCITNPGRYGQEMVAMVPSDISCHADNSDGFVGCILSQQRQQGLLHPTIYLFLLSGCRTSRLPYRRRSCVERPTGYRLTSHQRHLCSPSENHSNCICFDCSCFELSASTRHLLTLCGCPMLRLVCSPFRIPSPISLYGHRAVTFVALDTIITRSTYSLTQCSRYRCYTASAIL